MKRPIFTILSRKRRDCEKCFRSLEDIGFKKEFGMFGAESTLTYQMNDLVLTLTWETEDGNPGFLIKTLTGHHSLVDFEQVVRERHSFINPGQDNFLAWGWKLMDRNEYLELILGKVNSLLEEE